MDGLLQWLILPANDFAHYVEFAQILRSPHQSHYSVLSSHSAIQKHIEFPSSSVSGLHL